MDLSSEETSIHTVAALLKDLLRNVPGGILLSSRYTEFVATNDFKDVDTRVQHIQRYKSFANCDTYTKVMLANFIKLCSLSSPIYSHQELYMPYVEKTMW